MACETQFLCTGPRPSIYHAHYKDVNRNYTARSSFNCHQPPPSRYASLKATRSSCSRVSRDRRNRGVSGASSPSRVIYHTFPPHFASFAPALLSCLPCFPASFPSVLFTTHLIRILLALCLLCFLACLGFFCLVTVPLTLS